jgi:DMSO/TMAO reductase YedYZ molybdopterin-dependent catalytic subunit
MPGPPDLPRHSRTLAGAGCGIAAGGAALAAAQVGGALVSGAQPPLQVLGDLVIRVTPISVTEALIRQVGRNDKTVLLVSVLTVATLGAAGIGVRFVQGHARSALLAIALLAVLPVASTRGATGVTAGRELLVLLPAAVLGAVALRALATPLLPGPGVGEQDGSKTRLAPARRASRVAEETADVQAAGGLARRQVLRAAAVLAASTAVGTLAVRLIAKPSASLMRALAAALPRPTNRVALPVDEFASAGAAPLITPTAAFYRIDTSLNPPRVDPDTWRLTVSRDGKRLRSYTYDQLRSRAVHEADITIGCVSNEIGGNLIGSARWQGVLLADLLADAGVTSAGRVTGISVDGFVASFAAGAAFDGRPAMVAIGMNGRPLPIRHGFPARIVVPGLYGYTSAVKWLSTIDVSESTSLPGFWAERGWTPTVTVHVTSRIDSPSDAADIAAGDVRLAGIAWAPVAGIATVEVQIDDGPWTPARLSAPVSGTLWRQWSMDWTATRGQHSIRVRATDMTGRHQDTKQRPVYPSGATGLHKIVVAVT